MIQVFFYRIGEATLTPESFDTLADAVTSTRALLVPRNNRGWAPSIVYNVGGDSFRLSPYRRRAEDRLEWAMSFAADGLYKSWGCCTAERAGARYRSHRKGYRASERAFLRFVEAIDARASLPSVEAEAACCPAA